MGTGMKRRTLTVLAGALSLAGCATADLRPGIVRHETPQQIYAKFHGPDVFLRTSVVSAHNSRMIQPLVSLKDSAYLVIGDIGDDGTLRIIYPARPGEPNLIRKGEKFDAPRFQPRVIFPFMETTLTSAARTAPGIAFVIASSLPLQLEKLAEDDRWSMFDVYYDNHVNDPRPAITDLAAAISTDVGQVSIAYSAYAWGPINARRSAAQRSTPMDSRGRRRLPPP
jgi:hypothetical protein